MPDFYTHVLGSYALATGQSFNPTIRYIDDYGNERRSQILYGDASFLRIEGYSDIVSNLIVNGIINKGDPYKITQIESTRAQSGNTSLPDLSDASGHFGIEFNRSNQYFPLTWLPQAGGMRIGMLMRLDSYSVYQAGRITNLLFYIAIISAAIAIVPTMKELIVILSIIPTSLFCASSLMGDATLIAICTLSVAISVHELHKDGRSSNPALISISLLASFVTLIKATYLPICLGFLIFSKKIIQWKTKVMMCLPIALAALLYLIWSRTIGDVATVANIQANLIIAVTHFYVIVLSIIAYLGKLLSSIFVSSKIIYLVFAALVLAAALFPCAINCHKSHMQLRNHAARFAIGALVASITSYALICLFLLLTWNNLEAAEALVDIEGFQGRYLLPIYPVLLYLQVFWENQTEPRLHE